MSGQQLDTPTLARFPLPCRGQTWRSSAGVARGYRTASWEQTKLVQLGLRGKHISLFVLSKCTKKKHPRMLNQGNWCLVAFQSSHFFKHEFVISLDGIWISKKILLKAVLLLCEQLIGKVNIRLKCSPLGRSHFFTIDHSILYWFLNSELQRVMLSILLATKKINVKGFVNTYISFAKFCFPASIGCEGCFLLCSLQQFGSFQ